MNNQLENLRKEIDRLDTILLETLAKRLAIVKEIGKIKKQQNLPPLDKKRWEEVIISRLTQAKALNLPQDLVKSILESIHTNSLKVESEENK